MELGRQVIPLLAGTVTSWEPYVDGMFTFVKKNEIGNKRNILKGFRNDIHFIHCKGNITFFDANAIRKIFVSFSTSVYREKTDTKQ